MSYQATVLKVMIASPGDVHVERNLIREVIHSWNNVHSESSKIVLMPISWETHSTPQMGERAQGIINKQVLRDCDLLIGAFWTRFGTPTGAAKSGTQEEILEHLKAGKSALVYFSAAPVVVDSINIDQYQSVKNFETELRSQGITGSYNSVQEFKEMLTTQLAQTIIREFQNNVLDPNNQEQELAPLQVWLSSAARNLLDEAVMDQSGTILRARYMDGLEVSTNGKNFVDSADAKTAAKWSAAVDELVGFNFIEGAGAKGEVFRVTALGFAYVEEFSGNT